MCKALLSNGQGICFVLNNYWICILFMFYEINILVIFKFLCYLPIMNIIHWCLQYGVCLVLLEMSLYSSWFVHEPSSCLYLLQRETCFSALSVPHSAFSFFIVFISRVLYIYFCMCGGCTRLMWSMCCVACMSFYSLTAVDRFLWNLIWTLC